MGQWVPGYGGESSEPDASSFDRVWLQPGRERLHKDVRNLPQETDAAMEDGVDGLGGFWELLHPVWHARLRGDLGSTESQLVGLAKHERDKCTSGDD